MAYKFVGNSYGVQVYICDEETDLGDIPEKANEEYVCGTTAYVIADGKTRMMKSNGDWVIQ